MHHVWLIVVQGCAPQSMQNGVFVSMSVYTYTQVCTHGVGPFFSGAKEESLVSSDFSKGSLCLTSSEQLILQLFLGQTFQISSLVGGGGSLFRALPPLLLLTPTGTALAKLHSFIFLKRTHSHPALPFKWT